MEFIKVPHGETTALINPQHISEIFIYQQKKTENESVYRLMLKTSSGSMFCVREDKDCRRLRRHINYINRDTLGYFGKGRYKRQL